MKIQVLFLLLAFAFLSACEIINPEEEIPSYIYVEPFQLNTHQASEGSNSSKITEVWLSSNGVFLGAYRLPSLIPILLEGTQTLRLEAGIKVNGVSTDPDIYPFYNFYETPIDLQSNEVDTIRPMITYKDGIRFGFIEEFEGINNVFADIRAGRPQDRFYQTGTDVFEGNFSGILTVDSVQAFIELATLDWYSDLLDNGFSVFLEMDYKSETAAYFGVIGRDFGSVNQPIGAFNVGFRSKESWNKIYFDLSKLVSEGNFDEYKIGLQTGLTEDSGDTARIWLDNVKLVYF